MKTSIHRVWFATLFLCSAIAVSFGAPPTADPSSAEQIDFGRAKELLQKREAGGRLTADERAYLEKAIAARRSRRPISRPQVEQKRGDTIGLKPLSELTADERYQGQDGGLYGSGRNTPPPAHQRAAEEELARIRPLDRAGNPADDGMIGFVAISMSNATQEFSLFKQRADSDPAKSKPVVIVDCAQGGQAMAEWVDPNGQPWEEAARRLARAQVTDAQVQVAWIKLANKSPAGTLDAHGKKLYRDTLAVLHNASARFPNLRVAYLGSRIYAGHALTLLNPEPYAYESAFVCRWLIEAQVKGEPDLNYHPHVGPVQAPLLLWGPYLWADGISPRKADGLVWTREDFANDGTHPSMPGREKVAQLLLAFCKTNPLAKTWFSYSRESVRKETTP